MTQDEADALYNVMNAARELKLSIAKFEAITNKKFLRSESFFEMVLENFVTGKFIDYAVTE